MGKLIDLTGKIFGSLVVLSQAPNNKHGRVCWNCKCKCTKEKSISGKLLQNGHSKTCGECISGEISSAKISWQKRYSDLNFNIFLHLSQMNCHYCNLIPINKYKGKQKKSKLFIYNGLDRVDSNLNHNINNLVPCCRICNVSKLNHSYHNFLNWINSIYDRINYFNNIEYIDTISWVEPVNRYLLSSAKEIWRHVYKELSFDIFYTLSQMNCHYCNKPPTNCCNTYKNRKFLSQRAKEEGNFIYNGLDRIDNTKDHHLGNLVPACFQCNTAKSNQTLQEFKDWISRAHNHITENNLLHTDVQYFIQKYQDTSTPNILKDTEAEVVDTLTTSVEVSDSPTVAMNVSAK